MRHEPEQGQKETQMGKHVGRLCAILVAVCVFGAILPERNGEARVGGGRSIGSRGARSAYPGRSYAPSPRRDATSSPAQTAVRPGMGPSGGFLRSIAGGMLGGFLGGMLFRSFGFGGYGMGGTGFGLFEILLIGGIGYLIYRFARKSRREERGAAVRAYLGPEYASPAFDAEPEPSDFGAGLAHIGQMDPSFDEARFKDAIMDIFFRIQGAWMNRDLSSVASLLTDEMHDILQADVDRLLREKRINRLENIAVRQVDINDAWQEGGEDFITALIYANLLDYTVDEANGSIVAGSNLEPIKFEEYWTLCRPVGPGPWRLTAIDQK